MRDGAKQQGEAFARQAGTPRIVCCQPGCGRVAGVIENES